MLGNSIQWGLAAGFGTVLGALLIFIKQKWSAASLAFYLGLASGVMSAVVVFDMLPSALLYSGIGKVMGGLMLGVLLMAWGDRMLMTRLSDSHTLSGLGYLVMLGIALHDLPEGMAIALGDVMKSQTGMVIAMGIGIHNIPEGMAIAAPLVMAGIRKPVILMQIMALALITPLGTICGQYLTYVLPALLPLLLGAASGIMAYLVMFQLWPQAKLKDKQSRWWGFYLGVVIIFVATFII